MVTERDCAEWMQDEDRAFLGLVVHLRKLGATHVRVGDREALLSPPLVAASPRPTETAEEKRKREADEAERDLYWSSRA